MSALIGVSAQANDKQPNFLIIMADDLGYSDLGSYGGEIATPHLDALASEGLRLTSFHTAPTCSPTRAMLMSGTDSHIAGLGNMAELVQPFQVDQPGYEGYLNDRVASLAEVLQDGGYSTYTVGKWHLGRSEELSPKARGFDRSYILVQGGASHFDDQMAIISVDPKAIYREDGKQVSVPDGFFSSQFYTDKLIEYIEADRRSGKPFFGLLSYTAPHWPLHAPDEWLQKYEGRYAAGYEAIRQERLARMKQMGLVAADAAANVPMQGVLPDWEQLTDEQKLREARSMEVYAAMVDNMDHHIGRVIDYLKQTGEYDNTFILFLSDNGADGNSPLGLPGNDVWMKEAFDNSLENMGRKGSYIDYGAQWAQVSATPFPFFKGLTTQGGIQVPAIIRHPTVSKPGSINNEVAHIMDVMPTLLDLAGIQPPPGTFRGREVAPLQGVSMLPLLQDKAMPERAIGWELFGRKALRKGDWKILNMSAPYGNADWQLYNLADDPTEATNLAASQPGKLKELLGDWDEYVARNNVLSGEFNIRYGFETCLFEYCFK
ncbi:arylsulfatase [Pseudomonas sp. MYb185]|uniref:arylsulfatase n=1 Tax=Pseudomonas sp. MYb185 TaxID=1848729 RepID=UPI002115B6D5|nr:arylsulfatase [Pseudomonas sp. MYb185]